MNSLNYIGIAILILLTVYQIYVGDTGWVVFNLFAIALNIAAIRYRRNG